MNGRPAFFYLFAWKARRRPEGLCRGMLRSNELGMALSCKLIRAKHGEHGWNRTNDHLIKSQVLYRLSYVLV